MINEYINVTISNLSLNKLRYDNELVSEAFSLEINKLDTVDSSKISKYITALSQYLVYLTFELNKSKAMYKAYSNKLELKLLEHMGDVKGKTLKEKKAKILQIYKELSNLENDVLALKTEISLLEDLSGPIELYINALKRELSRRWNERELVRN